ncbi:MAG: amidase [Thiolinea sp.]
MSNVTTDSGLCLLPAVELSQYLLEKRLSACELLALFEQRIAALNPVLNALVTLDWEQAWRQARQADTHLATTGEALGLLHGLPLAVKDVFHVRGMRTTFGNLLFRDVYSDHDDLLVEREKAAGAVLVGKSNTPDCASGGVTRNEVFGLTLNPWNPLLTTSGSGGGGAAALAAGLTSLADGSDVGGSVRTPAGWTNIAGFRPSAGRIPGFAASMADSRISTAGVFGRCIADVMLFMQAVEGPDRRAPVPYPAVQGDFSAFPSLQAPQGKVGWLPAFAEVELADDLQALMAEAAQVLAAQGVRIAEPELVLGEDFRHLYAEVNAWAVTQGLPEPVLAACLRGEPVKASIQASVMRYLSRTPLEGRALLRQLDAPSGSGYSC